MKTKRLAGIFVAVLLCVSLVLAFEPRDRPVVHTGKGPTQAGDYLRTVKVGSVDRRYRFYVPKGYDPQVQTSVVIAFHGGGGSPESMMRLCQLNEKSDRAGFIVVYPFGTGLFADSMLTFNGGECCGPAMKNDVDDVGFTDALLDDLATIANIDVDRVFATGISNGGIMAHYVASKLPKRIAAIAPVGGPLMVPVVETDRAVSVMHFHGTADAFAPFKGGFGKNAFGGKGVTDFRSVEHTIKSWVKNNGCKPQPDVTTLPGVASDKMSVTKKTWRDGKNSSEVILVEIGGGGHTWPGQKPIVSLLGESTMDISANDMMWEFFQKHPIVR